MPTLDRAVLLPIAAAGLLALFYAIYLIFWVLRQPEGNDRMKEIAKAIQEGAQAYLNRQYTIIAGIGAVIFLFLTFTLGWKTGVLFLIGAVLSGAAGYVGMNISVRSNLRTAEAARGGIQPALRMAYRGGAVTGCLACLPSPDRCGRTTLYTLPPSPKTVLLVPSAEAAGTAVRWGLRLPGARSRDTSGPGRNSRSPLLRELA